MPRTSSVYYIAPSAISIVPNANGQASDLAVYVVKGAKVKVYYPDISELDLEDTTFQEWTLAGRNRRLREHDKPYTIYARLSKTDKQDAYLVFAAKVKDANDEWQDPYVLSPNTSSTSSTTTTDRSGKKHVWQPLPEAQARNGRQNYWWVKMGEVGMPAGGERTVDLDTGILGTDQYNTGWRLDPDALPMRVEIANSYATDIPYIYWGDEITVYPSLTEGFDTDVSSRVAYWTVTRNSGDADADARWNAGGGDGSASSSSSSDSSSSSSGDAPGRIITDSILLQHMVIGTDDFDRAASATFTFTAWGEEGASSSSSSSSSSSESSDSSSSSSGGIEPIASGSITILAETAEPRDRTYSEWVLGTPYYYRTINPERDPVTGKIYTETSYVWHGNKLWMCRVTGTAQEPSWDCTDWQVVSGDTLFKADFEEDYQLYDPDNFKGSLTVYVMWGTENLTGKLLQQDIVWTRYTEDQSGNPRTASDAIWNAQHAYSAWPTGRETLTLHQSDLNSETEFPSLVRFRCEVTLRDGANNEVYNDIVEIEYD